jgi:hypothetical protein
MNLQQAQIQGNMGLAAMNGLTNAGTALSNVGGQRADLGRLAQQMQLASLQARQHAGASQDARAQNALNLGYQDFQNARAWPYQQANFLMGQLQGIPMGVNQEAMTGILGNRGSGSSGSGNNSNFNMAGGGPG